MIAGDTFFAPLPPNDGPHLWIVLSDPAQNQSAIVVVPFMTLDDLDDSQDRTCTFDKGAHSIIDHPTFVNFDCTAAPSLSDIQAKKTGYGDPVTPELLAIIRDGAQQSTRCKLKYVYILEEQGLVDPE